MIQKRLTLIINNSSLPAFSLNTTISMYNKFIISCKQYSYRVSQKVTVPTVDNEHIQRVCNKISFSYLL